MSGERVVGFTAEEAAWAYRTLMDAMMQGCAGGHEPESIELRVLAKLRDAVPMS